VIRAGRLVAALALGLAPGAGAQAPEVQVAAVPEFAAVAPGGSFRVAVQLGIPDGWHIAWTNPGQSGLPTTLAWRTPDDISVGETEWPYPRRDESDGLVSHIYRGTVVVVTTFHVGPASRAGTATLRGEVSWGLCARFCVPQKRAVEVSFPVRNGHPKASAAWRRLRADLEELPVQGAGLTLRGVVSGDSVRLTIAGRTLGPWRSAAITFFPRESGAAVVVPARVAAGVVAVTLPNRVLRTGSRRLAGVLVADRPWMVTSPRRALVVETVVE
jgi:DsbC/DsbD-like thiol-disulfide interchange protein